MNVFLQLKSGLRLSSFVFRFSILMFSFFSFSQMLACLHKKSDIGTKERKRERKRGEVTLQHMFKTFKERGKRECVNGQ
jgi:hypothetical protein